MVVVLSFISSLFLLFSGFIIIAIIGISAKFHITFFKKKKFSPFKTDKIQKGLVNKLRYYLPESWEFLL